MDEATPPTRDGDGAPLAGIRRRIDAIDDELLRLLIARFEAVDAIRAAKQAPAGTGIVPVRPAREAVILRRLLAGAGEHLPARLIVRVWRAIVTEATARQGPVRVHASAGLHAEEALASGLRDHFCDLEQVCHEDAGAAVAALAAAPADVAVVAPDEPWHAALADAGSRAGVICALPVLAGHGPPPMLVIGRAPNEPTGDDETLVASRGGLPREFVPSPLWQVARRDGVVLTSLPGFLAESEVPLVGLKRNQALAMSVLGRYPSPIVSIS